VTTSGNVTIAPREGKLDSFVGYGVILDKMQPAQGGRVDLNRDTQTLLKGLAQSNSGMQVTGQGIQATIGGLPALVTRLSSDSPYKGIKETDVVITIDRGTSLVYLICIAPEPDYSRFEPVFQQMTRTIRFQ